MRSVRRKDGELVPVTTPHLGTARRFRPAWRHGGRGRGSERDLHREQAQRESQERYRDLFEHSSEMIATLSPTGQFLYANPAWKRLSGWIPGGLARSRHTLRMSSHRASATK